MWGARGRLEEVRKKGGERTGRNLGGGRERGVQRLKSKSMKAMECARGGGGGGGGERERA